MFCVGIGSWGWGFDRSVVGYEIASEATQPRNDGRGADGYDGRGADRSVVGYEIASEAMQPRNDGRGADGYDGRGADRSVVGYEIASEATQPRNDGRGADGYDGRGADRSVVGYEIASEATQPRNDGRGADGYDGRGADRSVVGYEIASEATQPRNDGKGADRNDGRGADRNDGRGADCKGQGAATVIRAAQKEIGVLEAGQNSGPRVDQYCAYVGLKRVAWCAAFVSFIFGEAGYAAPRTAWSPSLFPAGKRVKEAGPGTVMGLYYTSLGRVGHCGIVCKIRGDWLETVEGNTSCGAWLAPLSSRRARFVPRNDEREGQGVYRKMRHKRTIHCYANWL